MNSRGLVKEKKRIKTGINNYFIVCKEYLNGSSKLALRIQSHRSKEIRGLPVETYRDVRLTSDSARKLERWGHLGAQNN